MNKNITQNSQTSQTPSPQLLERIVNIQEKQVELNYKEIEFRKLNEENGFKYAHAALETNAKDRDEERKHKKSVVRYILIFSGLLILMLFAFLSIAIFLNKDQLAYEIIKAILFFGSGGIGGYFFGKKNPKEDT